MKVAIYTLGCKVNQYETQAMEQELLARGHTLTEFSDEADAYIVNTCSVTAVSDQKSRQVIHGVQRKHTATTAPGCRPRSSRPRTGRPPTRRRWWMPSESSEGVGCRRQVVRSGTAAG